MDEVAVVTPEKAVVTFRLASIGDRFRAQLLDMAILLAIWIAVSIVVPIFFAPFSAFVGLGVTLALVSATPFAYFILFEGLHRGRTIGKSAVGVRVTMADGTPITLSAAASRNLMRIADFLPALYFLGFLAVFSSSKGQRLGDIVADTIVISTRRPMTPMAPAPHFAGRHALEPYLGSLHGMTPDEYAAMRRFADRFPELDHDVQQRLVETVWNPFAAKRGIPSVPNVHPIYLAEAVVMKYGREHGVL